MGESAVFSGRERVFWTKACLRAARFCETGAGGPQLRLNSGRRSVGERLKVEQAKLLRRRARRGGIGAGSAVGGGGSCR